MKKMLILTAFFCNSVCANAQIFEQFTDSGIGNSYSSGSFVGNGDLRWNYVKARGNQQTTTNGDKAISLNKAADACIFSDTIPNGVRFIQFQYEQELTTSCDASVFVNDMCVGTLRTDSEADVTKIFSASVDSANENAVVRIQQNSAASGQLTIDDIYIEFAKTPFVCTEIVRNEHSVLVRFSHKILSANVLSDAIERVEIEQNTISVRLKDNLCGEYSIAFQQVVDTALETLPDTTITIAFFQEPSVNQVVITEVMMKPTPVVGLPEFEYIEFSNLSDCAIQCSDLQLVVGTNICELPTKILLPREYVYVISEKARASISDTTHCIFLSKMPTIANAQQTIALVFQQKIVSSVTVDETWYGDAFKADGGWSLEKIDVENCSETAENWSAANNRVGGTPGYENSVARRNADNEQPTISSIQILNDSTIEVVFSEQIDIEQIGKFSISPQVTIDTVLSVHYMGEKFQILTQSAFLPQTEYVLHIPDDCTDFAGNQFAENQYVFAVTDSVLERNSICINEILFNPKSGSSDFVELYNNSDSYFDLSQLYLSNGQSFSRISNSFVLFPPRSYVVISPDADNLDNHCDNSIFIKNSLPSMPDDEGTIMVLNRWEDVIDSVSYSEKWHSSYLTDREGVSLERIAFSMPSERANSWCSAAELAGFSTPGCENSQSHTLYSSSMVRLESEVVTPNGDGENDEMVLLIGNCERASQSSVHICSPAGKVITQLANNQLLGVNDCVRWNCTNSDGKLVPAGIYLVSVEVFSNGRKTYGKKLSCTVLRD